MARNEATPNRDDAPLARPRRTLLDVAVWRQVALNVAYVLVAAPLGMLYLCLFALALALDLPYLATRMAIAGGLRLLYACARASLWVLRYGIRYIFTSVVWVVVGTAHLLWWLCVSLPRSIARAIGSVFFAIMHPRRAWRRRRERRLQAVARPRTPRRLSVPIIWPGGGAKRARAERARARGDRFFDTAARTLKHWRQQIVPDRWIFVPVIWWRLALWEHTHTARWLQVTLPSLEPSHPSLVHHRTVVYPPGLSLLYLVLKLPLGMLAAGVVALTVVAMVQVIDAGTAGALLLPLLVGGGVLHLLAVGCGQFAARAFSPSEATRRWQAAEALATQERAKAERAEQSRRDLIVNVGHELRTPTASILGHVESVLLALDAPDGTIEPETLRTYLGIIQREAERLSSLVDDLLAVARAERSDLGLERAPLDAATVIREVYEALAPLARRERQVMLVHDIEPDAPLAYADRQRLSQVLLNLVRNAITYTPTGGIVSVVLRRVDHERVQLTVADTGIGIAPADLERIFERFFRADASRARASGGFGLGLAIARDLVEAMGGTLTAESIVGEGSAFHVTLPVATAEQTRSTRLMAQGH